MKKLFLLLGCLLHLDSFSQKQMNSDKNFQIAAFISNPNETSQVGWFEVDGESFDDGDVNKKSISVGVLTTYTTNNLYSFRTRFGITKLNSIESGGSSNGITYDSIFVNGKQNQFHFAPGIFWHSNPNMFSFFGGFELPINIYKEYQLSFQSESRDNNNILISNTKSYSTIPGGYSIGIGAVFGFNYHLKCGISFGAEFSPSLLYSHLGGTTTSYETTSPQIVYHTNDKLSGFTELQQRFSLIVSYKLF